MRALSNLDTSFDEQVKTTIVQEQSSSTINTVAALAEKAAESDEGATLL